MNDETTTLEPEPTDLPAEAVEPVVEAAPADPAPAPVAAADPMVEDASFDPADFVKKAMGYDDGFPDGSDVLAQHITTDQITNLPSDARAIVVSLAARVQRMEAQRREKFEAEQKAAAEALAAREAALNDGTANLERREAAFKQMAVNPKTLERLRAQVAAKPENPDPNKPEDIVALAEAKAAETTLQALEEHNELNRSLRQTAERDRLYAQHGIKPGSDESKRVNEIIAEMYGDIETVRQATATAMSQGKPENVPLARALKLYDVERKTKAAEQAKAAEAADRADAARRLNLRPGPQAEVDLQSEWDRYKRSDPRLDNLTAALNGQLGPNVQRAVRAFHEGLVN